MINDLLFEVPQNLYFLYVSMGFCQGSMVSNWPIRHRPPETDSRAFLYSVDRSRNPNYLRTLEVVKRYPETNVPTGREVPEMDRYPTYISNKNPLRLMIINLWGGGGQMLPLAFTVIFWLRGIPSLYLDLQPICKISALKGRFFWVKMHKFYTQREDPGMDYITLEVRTCHHFLNRLVSELHHDVFSRSENHHPKETTSFLRWLTSRAMAI